MTEYESLFQNVTCFPVKRSAGWSSGKETAPDFVAAVGNHQPANQSAHAVANQHDSLVIRERALNAIKITAK